MTDRPPPPNADAPNMLEEALALVARGYRVLPLHTPTFGADGTCNGCSCGRPECRPGGTQARDVGKHPRTRRGVADATADPAQVRKWWERWPEANIGIATGNGLVVLDVDGPQGRAAIRGLHVPLTVTAQSGRDGGGYHVYLRASAGVRLVNRSGALPGVDLKTDGGYVVAPPSMHATGRRYTWGEYTAPGDVRIADAPDWIVDLATAQPQPDLAGSPGLADLDFSRNRPAPPELEKALRDGTFRAHFERRSCEGNPSRCDLGLANWGFRRGWSAQAVVDAIITARRRNRDKPRPMPTALSFWTNTLAKAQAAARNRPVPVPVALVGAVPASAVRLWAILKHATANGDRPTQADLAAKCGVKERRVRDLVRDLEAVGALVTRQAGDGHPLRYEVHDLPGPRVAVDVQRLADCSASALVLWIALTAATRRHGATMYQAAVGDLCGTTARTVRRHVADLEARSWLTVERNGPREPLAYYPRGPVCRADKNCRAETALVDPSPSATVNSPAEIVRPICIESQAPPSAVRPGPDRPIGPTLADTPAVAVDVPIAEDTRSLPVPVADAQSSGVHRGGVNRRLPLPSAFAGPLPELPFAARAAPTRTPPAAATMRAPPRTARTAATGSA